MRLLVSGYRDYNDEKEIERTLNLITKEEKDVTLIHGNCKGVDKIAEQIARKKKWNIVSVSPNWKLGLKAGPLRNEYMITECKPDFAVIFLSDKSKGTTNMKSLLEKHNIWYLQIDI